MTQTKRAIKNAAKLKVAKQKAPKKQPKKVSATEVAAEKRTSNRVETAGVKVKNLTSLSEGGLISRQAIVVDASNTGFLIQIKREDLIPQFARSSLTLNELIDHKIILILEQMNLEMAGRVARARRIDRTTFEIGIDYSDEAPEYWRECLMDLFPRPGEL